MKKKAPVLRGYGVWKGKKFGQIEKKKQEYCETNIKRISQGVGRNVRRERQKERKVLQDTYYEGGGETEIWSVL